MPVTKTAHRALRSSKRKQKVNTIHMTKLDIAIRNAKTKPTEKNIIEATKLVDRAVKNRIIHKNKGARFKSRIASFSAKKTKK